MADDARQLIATLLAGLALGPGCAEDSRCEFTERPATLDEAWGSADLATLREDFMQPRIGILTWQSFVQELTDMPPVGTSSFTLQLQLGDAPTARVGERVGGHDDERLMCPTEVDFDVVIELTTGDGVLDERWEATATVQVETLIPTLVIDLADPPLSLPLMAPDSAISEPEVRASLVVRAGQDPPVVSGWIDMFAQAPDEREGTGQFWPIATLGPV